MCRLEGWGCVQCKRVRLPYPFRSVLLSVYGSHGKDMPLFEIFSWGFYTLIVIWWDAPMSWAEQLQSQTLLFPIEERGGAEEMEWDRVKENKVKKPWERERIWAIYQHRTRLPAELVFICRPHISALSPSSIILLTLSTKILSNGVFYTCPCFGRMHNINRGSSVQIE